MGGMLPFFPVSLSHTHILHRTHLYESMCTYNAHMQISPHSTTRQTSMLVCVCKNVYPYRCCHTWLPHATAALPFPIIDPSFLLKVLDSPPPVTGAGVWGSSPCQSWRHWEPIQVKMSGDEVTARGAGRGRKSSCLEHFS